VAGSSVEYAEEEEEEGVDDEDDDEDDGKASMTPSVCISPKIDLAAGSPTAGSACEP
jgi:hypothetical protein